MAAKKTAKKAATNSPTSARAAKTARPKKTEAAPAVKTARKAAAKAPPKTTSRPPLDAVARAAYLNYRRRVELGLPGDSHGDWLHAERQLSDGTGKS